jgi:hypothetical protein
MTAFTGNDAAAAARCAEAQELIGQAQSGYVLLTVLSAMDLCALDGARQVLFDEAPAKAWAGMRRRARMNGPAVIFGGLEQRGLPIRQAPAVPLAARGGDQEPGLGWAMSRTRSVPRSWRHPRARESWAMCPPRTFGIPGPAGRHRGESTAHRGCSEGSWRTGSRFRTAGQVTSGPDKGAGQY